MDIRIGLCGFSMAMRDYPRHFPVVEVQQTFYEPPRDDVMAKWRAATGPALEYTMKVWQLVTHAAGSPTYRRMKSPIEAGGEPGFFRDTAAVAAGWLRSLECAKVLTASAMLFQCPASFRPDPENVRRLRGFFERIARPPLRLLWEPRGDAWLAERDLALAICRELDLVYVIDPFVTEPSRGAAVYWRLHGIDGVRHSYTDAELFRLHRMLEGADPNGAAYVLFNNLPRIGDARRFAALCGQHR